MLAKLRIVLAFSLFALIAVLAFASLASAQDVQPLLDGGVETLPVNGFEVYVGEEYLHGFRSIRTHEPGDLWKHGQIALRWGVSDRVELEADGSAQKRFKADSGRVDSGVGDFSIWGKFLVWKGAEPGTAIGLRFGVKMPNTPTEKDFGTNQTDYYSEIIAGRALGKLKLWGQLGLGILDNPYRRQSQDDIYIYTLAFSYPVKEHWTVEGDARGFFSRGEPTLYGDNHSMRLGISVDLRRDLALSASFASSSGRLYGDWSGRVGLKYRFGR